MDGEKPAFVAMRALFCFVIVFHHAYTSNERGRDQLIEETGWKTLFHCIFERGYLGADGFLLMSGWLNAASLSSALKKTKFWEVTSKFWIRRYFRLAPLMYVHLIFVYTFFDFCDLKSIIGNFIFLGNCTNIYCI